MVLIRLVAVLQWGINLMLKKLIITIIFCLFAANTFAATYYIDYTAGNDSNNGTSTATAWKTHPYMNGSGVSGYVHSAGDVFVFKGGVTWPYSVFPMTLAYSGTNGNKDVYMGGQQCGYTPATPFQSCDGIHYPCGSTASVSCNGGGAWGTGYPVFNANNALGTSAYIIGDNGATRSYLIFDGLFLENIGNPTDGTGSNLKLTGGGSSIEVKNNNLQPDGNEAFSYVTTGTSSALYFHDNYITMAGRIVIYSNTGGMLTDLQVYNNNFVGIDFGEGAFYHLDGFMIGNSATNTCGSGGVATINGSVFHHNKFSGTWETATARVLSQ